MEKRGIGEFLNSAFEGMSDEKILANQGFLRGKVRDIQDLGTRLLISTSDRISAFDVVLTTIPCKGEVLNGLANYWFDQTRDIIPNHIEKTVSARTVLVKKCDVLPVEVVVRGYLTGSAWRDYDEGKTVSGIPLPEGMKFNQRFEKPLLTPSTKAERGDHDEPISSAAIVERGLVEEELWRKVELTAHALFQRGSSMLTERGLILVDTKYEFGLLDGELILIDEVHTPDSSRFWFQDTYQELFDAGEKQRKIDKEYLRQWLMEKGYMGNGTPPAIPDEVKIEVAWRYVQAYQLITGTDFVPSGNSPEAEMELIRSYLS
ncbi:MAG: phosphoribosylaminoimidazolesuccinocarboxamide synthase [Spirochaetales bacterium]|jgi:phosphoribosylaminoimidazole-succinocarboxamide synthase|nr:phosphoribosylaminoimidazolesuccinocarboxamide synthase [Spirochaetales bacterium]